MKRARQTIVPVDIREIYAAMGTYSVKFLIDQKVSQKLEAASVTMFDADGREMRCTSRRWGTKLNVSFDVDKTTPDGAAIVQIDLNGADVVVNDRFRVWIIK